MYLGDSLISWKCKKQDKVSKSSTEAEYRVMSAACSEILWLRGLLSDLRFPADSATPLYADNTSAIRIIANPVFHERTKHIEIDCHFIRDEYKRDVISLPHIFSDLQNTDILTKGLPRPWHQFLVSKLMLVDSPASICGGGVSNTRWLRPTWAQYVDRLISNLVGFGQIFAQFLPSLIRS